MTPERWQQIEQIFHAALERQPSQRAELLTEACAGDEALRREVESLLAAHGQTGGFFEPSPSALAADLLGEDPGESVLGRRVGHYKILSLLGAGGMGEVYLAQDTRLGRQIALKLLPAEFTRDKERLQRFEREAQAASALNHPNILTIYEIGQAEAFTFMATEFIDGQTLRQRMAGKRMKLAEILDVAIQVSNALAASHQAGIVHRDIKPENIMRRRDGYVKVLDFGLAKLGEPQAAPSDSSASTGETVKTEPGRVMGTAYYMSPEQALGQEVDQRSDIFSLGVVLYEMATGTVPFKGSGSTAVIDAILHQVPTSPLKLKPDLPIELERIINEALEKDREVRYQTASGLRADLKRLQRDMGSTPEAAATGATPAAAPRARWKRWMMGVGAAVLAALALTVALTYFQRAPTKAGAARFQIFPPEKAFFSIREAPAISPDGRRLAFVAVDSSRKTLLWVRGLDSFAAQALPGTENAQGAFWSPDSRLIGFFAQGKLKKIEASGGPVQALCDVSLTPSQNPGGTWNREGVIVFAPSRSNDVMYRVSAAGGVAEPVTTLDRSRHDEIHEHPYFLPDGRHFVYAINTESLKLEIFLGSLDTKEKRHLLSGVLTMSYAPGYLFYVREGGALMAQPFDANNLRLTQEPFLIGEHKGYASVYGTASASENGVLAYRSADNPMQLVWFDRSGKELGSVTPPGTYHNPRLSPDEKSVAAARLDPQTVRSSIWLFDLLRGTSTRFTFAGHDYTPVWSPDGSRIVFRSSREGQATTLSQKLVSGVGREEVLLKADCFPNDWSLDGRYISYSPLSPKGDRDLWVLPLFGDREPMPFVQTEFNEQGGRFSPDGRWMAYASNESGTAEVYVQPFPASGRRWQISTQGGRQPAWRRDGKELFYCAPDGKLMAVPVKAGQGFEAGVPRVLFQTRLGGGPFGTFSYEVAADGQRFLITALTEGTAAAPITIVLNWTAELKR